MVYERNDISRKTELIILRISLADKGELKGDAQVAGMTLSEYVRKRAVGVPVIASADLTTVRELRRLGGLLKSVHVQSGGAYSEATAGALNDLRLFIMGLSHDC